MESIKKERKSSIITFGILSAISLVFVGVSIGVYIAFGLSGALVTCVFALIVLGLLAGWIDSELVKNRIDNLEKRI